MGVRWEESWSEVVVGDLADVRFEELAEFDWRDVVVDLTVHDVRDGAGFFAHDDAYDVNLLAYAYCRAVTEAEVGVNLVVG